MSIRLPFLRKRKTKRSPLLLVFTLTIIVLLIPVIFFALSHPNKSSAVWFDPAWSYRSSIAITNNGSAQTSYQVMVSVDTYTLSNASKLQSDCDDLRFANAQGTSLSYFLEYCVSAASSGNSIIWVTLPSIPASSVTNRAWTSCVRVGRTRSNPPVVTTAHVKGASTCPR